MVQRYQRTKKKRPSGAPIEVIVALAFLSLTALIVVTLLF